MAQTHTDTNVNQLIINKLTKQEYNNLQQVSDTELYLVEEQVDSVVTQNSTNPVQSNAVYQALQNHHDVIMVYFAHNKAYTVSLTDAYYDTTDEELVAQDPATWTGQTPQLPIITAGYYYDLLTGKIYYIENEGDLPVEVTDVEIQGDTNKLYIDLNTSKAYRWNGSTFVLIAAGGSYNDLADTPQNATTTTAGLMSAEDKSKVDTIGIVYRGQLQHNMQIMQSGSNLIHVYCQDYENDGIYLDCYIASRGTTGSVSTFSWHYAFIHTNPTLLDIQCNYNGVINVINNTGRPDSDFVLFIDKLI